jgi:hypothetical protein
VVLLVVEVGINILPEVVLVDQVVEEMVIMVVQDLNAMELQTLVVVEEED